MKEKFLLIFGVLVLTNVPASAGRVDVGVGFDFGNAIAETIPTSSPSGPAGFALTVTARVWHDDVTGIYTYVYEFTDNGSSLTTINSLSIGTADFDGSLNWGTVGGSVSSSFNTTFGNHLTFQFYFRFHEHTRNK